MFLVTLIFSLCGPLTVRGSLQEQGLAATDFATRLIHGFKDYPLVVWTNDQEPFPQLAQTLINQVYKEYFPVELWLESHPGWRLPLKFAPAKPLYAIFPPRLANYSENPLLNMLLGFTDCYSMLNRYYVHQITDHIFLFISNIHDGSQEVPWVIQDRYSHCVSPPKLFFLKYTNYQDDINTMIQLESLRGLRMRCWREDGYPCIETVKESDTHGILQMLSSEKIQNLIQVDWRKIERTHVYTFSLPKKSVIRRYGSEWPQLKALFIDQSYRRLRSKLWSIQVLVPMFELLAKTNMTTSQPSKRTAFHYFSGLITYGAVVYDIGRSPSYLRLLCFRHFVVLYTSDQNSHYNPLTAKSLSGASGPLEIAIVFGLLSLITILQRPRNLNDFTKSALSSFACIFSQAPSYQIEKHRILQSLWIILIWFSTTMYLSCLQSERVVPAVQVGNETLEDLLERHVKLYATGWAFRFYQEDYMKISEGVWLPQEAERRRKVSSNLHEKDFWALDVPASRKFFQLSTWALLLENFDVAPMTKVFTSYYSKDYLTLEEKFAELVDWIAIMIPQGEYVLEAFKGIEESGILSYWNEISAEGNYLDCEQAIRRLMLHYSEQMWEQHNGFIPMNTSDSVFLEGVTLSALIISLVITIMVTQFAWVRVREWIGSRVKKLMGNANRASSELVNDMQGENGSECHE